MKVLVKKGFVVLSVVAMLFSGLFIDKTVSLAASGDTTVYITKTGECYHADGCASLRRSKIATTLQNAVDKGFRACSKCHPASLDASTSTGIPQKSSIKYLPTIAAWSDVPQATI